MSGNMPCPKCSHSETSVKDSRPSGLLVPNVRRVRKCESCGHRFRTRELMDDAGLEHFADLSALSKPARKAVRALIRAVAA